MSWPVVLSQTRPPTHWCWVLGTRRCIHWPAQDLPQRVQFLLRLLQLLLRNRLSRLRIHKFEEQCIAACRFMVGRRQNILRIEATRTLAEGGRIWLAQLEFAQARL